MTRVVHDLSRYVLRSKGRVQSMGPSWPTGAVVAYRDDRFALIGEDWFTVRKGTLLADGIAEAERLVRCGGKGLVRVGRPVGRFGEANLYEPVIAFAADDYAPRAHARAKVATAAASDRRGELVAEFEVKAKDDPGKPVMIEGWASRPDIDRDFDVVDPMAFKESLPSYLANPQLLWMHDWWHPIGAVEEIELKKEGIFVRARVEDEEVKRYIRTGQVNSFSISFDIQDRAYEPVVLDEDGVPTGPQVMRVTKGELLEISVVTIPSLRSARFEVVKRAKAQDKAAEIGTCDASCSRCTCELPERVVEYRGFPIGNDLELWDAEAVRKRFGAAADVACHTFEQEGAAVLRHAALQGGELRTIPCLVRLAMASIVARHHDMTDEQRQVAWSSVGKRWMDCFPREDVPLIERHPAPGLFAKIAGGLALEFDARSYDEARAKKFLDGHGYQSAVRPVVRKTQGSGAIAVADGVFAMLPSERGAIEVKTKKSKTQAPAKPEAGKKPEEQQPEPASKDVEEMALFDDTDVVELESSTVSTVERVLAGQPVSAAALQSAVDDGKRALADVLGQDSEDDPSGDDREKETPDDADDPEGPELEDDDLEENGEDEDEGEDDEEEDEET